MLLRGEVGLLAKALVRPGGIDRLLADHRRQVLVGLFDGVVMGLSIARLDDDGMGVVEVCYVDPTARGVGVGLALLDAVLTWLTASGCSGVDATALPGDREAKRLFESSGFMARAIVLHRPVGEPPPD